MNYYGKTDRGLVREQNQDCVFYDANLKDQVIAVVADGMGGHKAGEIASKAVTNYIANYFNATPPFQNGQEALAFIEDAITKSDEVVKKMAQTNSEHRGMGTTIAMAVAIKNQIHIAHVGDSRAYLFDGTSLEQVTSDHTLVNELVRTGAISVEEAKNHSKKHVLYQAIGASEKIEAAIATHDFTNRMCLLCSDGLYNCVEDRDIIKILKSKNKLPAKVEQLIKKANLNGGYDNISVCLIDNLEVVHD
ncbi:MAG: Stp1/IreP family PP2C-type Ser/Thr phosphatase [Erysipelotrichaceae bacterium]|nr:Stp1/IreP family PP2C-type Ser/Thr phosphatase [Erysipelotrichaceae bacterium]MDD3809549.1 Stp1/IreP family PP2C-type Ser/Thr phosphatase [Erysipelotrichaceae bacterium]